MNSLREPTVQHLVADSAAFIRNIKLQEIGVSIYTCNEVVSEIKDAQTRERLQVLPYELQIKRPINDALKNVTEFSKKTGDFPSLSATDLQVLALTYQLQSEHGGVEHLSTQPNIQATYTSSRAPVQSHKELAGFYAPGKREKYKEKKTDNEEASDESSEEDDDVSDSDWITPDNIGAAVAKMNSDTVTDRERSTVSVACLTTDFAMQNVLVHMGLNVVSTDGYLVKRLKSYVLRCHGCYKTTSVMTKKFCPSCGNQTLDRVSVTVDPDGTVQYHLSRRKQPTTRGLNCSLPTPKGGKHAVNPQLFEDQPMAQNRLSKKALEKLNPLEPDYLARDSPFLVNDVNSKSALMGFHTHSNTRRKGKRRGGKKA